MIGIDILKISRVESLLEKKRFFEKFFTESEQNYIIKKNKNIQTIAGLVSAKEAVSKAFGVGLSGELGLLDIEILHDGKNSPYINTSNKKIKKLMKDKNINSIDISITHDGEYTITICKLNILEGKAMINKDYDMSSYYIPKRKDDSNKYDYGKILIVGGSKGMTGSIMLASRAALRTGAGMVYVLAPSCVSDICEIKSTEQIILDIKDKGTKEFGEFDREELLNIIPSMSVIAIGPGLGRGKYAKDILEIILNNFDGPIVVDADAINLISEFEDLLNSNIYLTPHTGEFAKLSGYTLNEINYDKVQAVYNYLDKHDVNILLKGKNSIVTNSDICSMNYSGNNGMATAGSGDVLTGVIAALLARTNNFDMFRTAVFLHGLAGDMAREKYGENSLIASDIIEFLPMAIGEIYDN